MDVICENYWFNSPASFCDKYYLRLEAWEKLMVLSFTLNKQNYARHGTYYLTQMGSLDSTHPGAHEEIQEKGISFCRNSTDVRQSIDGTGNKRFWGTRRLQQIIFHFLCVLGVLICSFSEEANIFLFSILGPHEIALSRTTQVYVILVCII